jgi:hypothetical protein
MIWESFGGKDSSSKSKGGVGTILTACSYKTCQKQFFKKQQGESLDMKLSK